MGEKHRHFGRGFKRDAVQLVTERGMPVGKVARELDIHPNLLHLWRRRFLARGDKAFVGKGCVTPEGAEIKGLRKELEKVKGNVAITNGGTGPRSRVLKFGSVRAGPVKAELRHRTQQGYAAGPLAGLGRRD